MISDEEKQEIGNSITKAFDKWGNLYYQNLFTELNKKKFETYNVAYDEQRFLKKRAIDISTYMYVQRKCNDSKIISKHRSSLIKTTIISIIRSGFTLSEFNSENTQNTKYTSRHKQRLVHDYYKETFFEIDLQKKKDDRFNIFSSVFSTNNIPDSDTADIATEYQSLDYAFATSNKAIMERLSFNSILRFAFPPFLEDLLKFKDECKFIFEHLGENNDRIDYLRNQLTEFTPLLQSFYFHLTSILALNWFHFSSKETQKSYFTSEFKVKYNKTDAEQAKKLLLTITKSNELTSYLLSYCANAFIHYTRYLDAVSLFEQCISLTDKVLEKGILWQNIAVAYRSNENFKLMLQAMKKSLSYYKKSNSVYHICMAQQLVGESRWRIGLKESAMNSFQEAENTGKLLNPNEAYKIPHNIGMSFARLGEKSLRDKYWTKALTLIPEKETDMILRLNDMLNSR